MGAILICIKLEDKLLNKVVDLGRDQSYTFKMKISDDPNRFTLCFNKDISCMGSYTSAGLDDINNEVEVTSIKEGNLINFNFKENTPVTKEVVSMLGQKLISTERITANTQSEKIILPSDYSGIYLIEISSGKGTVIRKFYK